MMMAMRCCTVTLHSPMKKVPHSQVPSKNEFRWVKCHVTPPPVPQLFLSHPSFWSFSLFCFDYLFFSFTSNENLNTNKSCKFGVDCFLKKKVNTIKSVFFAICKYLLLNRVPNNTSSGSSCKTRISRERERLAVHSPRKTQGLFA